MNWKRGFVRIYVVVWMISALVGMGFAISNTARQTKIEHGIRSYMMVHHAITTNQLIALMKNDGDSLYIFPADSTDLPLAFHDDERGWERIAGITSAPRAITWTWVLWFAGLVLAPGLLLVSVRWVIAGFRK